MNKSIVFISVLVIINVLSGSSQERYVFSGGGTQFNFEEKQEVPIGILKNNGFYIGFEATPTKNVAGKFQYTSTLPQDGFKYWDLKLGAFFMIRPGAGSGEKGTRLTFPIGGSFTIYRLEDEQNFTYGSIGFSAQGGLRFYLTQRLAIEGYYGYSIQAISRLNDEEPPSDFTKSFNANQLSVGVAYYFENN